MCILRLSFGIRRDEAVPPAVFFKLLYAPATRLGLKGEMWLETKAEKLYCIVLEGVHEKMATFGTYMQLTLNCLGATTSVKWTTNAEYTMGPFRYKRKPECRYSVFHSQVAPQVRREPAGLPSVDDTQRLCDDEKERHGYDEDVASEEAASPATDGEPAVKSKDNEEKNGSEEYCQDEDEAELSPVMARERVGIPPIANEDQESQLLEEPEQVAGGNQETEDLFSDEEDDEESQSILSSSRKRRRM